MPRTVIEEAHCPACDGKGLEYTTEPVDLPFMGTSMEIAISRNLPRSDSLLM